MNAHFTHHISAADFGHAVEECLVAALKTVDDAGLRTFLRFNQAEFCRDLYDLFKKSSPEPLVVDDFESLISGEVLLPAGFPSFVVE